MKKKSSLRKKQKPDTLGLSQEFSSQSPYPFIQQKKLKKSSEEIAEAEKREKVKNKKKFSSSF